MTEPSANNWHVEVTTTGPYGSILYQEGRHSASFLWEFGGGEIIAMIHLTTSLEWDDRYPWAAGRRDEVLQRIVNDVRRQKCANCAASIVEQNGKSYVYFRKPA